MFQTIVIPIRPYPSPIVIPKRRKPSRNLLFPAIAKPRQNSPPADPKISSYEA